LDDETPGRLSEKVAKRVVWGSEFPADISKVEATGNAGLRGTEVWDEDREDEIFVGSVATTLDISVDVEVEVEEEVMVRASVEVVVTVGGGGAGGDGDGVEATNGERAGGDGKEVPLSFLPTPRPGMVEGLG